MDIDPELLHELDAKARIPEKRPLIDAINKAFQASVSKSKSTVPEREQPAPAPAPPALPYLDPALLAALSPALSMLSASSTGTAAPNAHSAINATNDDIAVPRPDLYRVLYDDMALQCKTCGLRFSETLKGKADMAEHLDAHFKRNMKLKDSTKRLMTRDWFAPESEWIMGDEKAVESKPGNIKISGYPYFFSVNF